MARSAVDAKTQRLRARNARFGGASAVLGYGSPPAGQPPRVSAGRSAAVPLPPRASERYALHAPGGPLRPGLAPRTRQAPSAHAHRAAKHPTPCSWGFLFGRVAVSVRVTFRRALKVHAHRNRRVTPRKTPASGLGGRTKGRRKVESLEVRKSALGRGTPCGGRCGRHEGQVDPCGIIDACR